MEAGRGSPHLADEWSATWEGGEAGGLLPQLLRCRVTELGAAWYTVSRLVLGQGMAFCGICDALICIHSLRGMNMNSSCVAKILLLFSFSFFSGIQFLDSPRYHGILTAGLWDYDNNYKKIK